MSMILGKFDEKRRRKVFQKNVVCDILIWNADGSSKED